MPAPTPRPASGAPAPGSSTLATPRASARRAIDASDLDRSEQVSQRFPSSLLTNYTCPNLSGAQQDANIAKRETSLREREEAVSKERQTIGDQVDEKLRHERSQIAAEEARKAKLALQTDIDRKTREV